MVILDIPYDYNGLMIFGDPRNIDKVLFLDIFPRKALSYSDFSHMMIDIAAAFKGVYFHANWHDPVVFLYGPMVNRRKNMLCMWLQNWTEWDRPTDTYRFQVNARDGFGIYIAQYRYEVKEYEDYVYSENIPVDIPVETLTKIAAVMDKYSVFLDTSMF